MVNKTRGTLPNSPGAPVRFYKFVAVTFLLLTLALLGLIVFMSAKRAEITVTTRSDTVNATFPVELGPGVPEAAVKGTVTTTLVTASKAFVPTGLRVATGTVVATVQIFNDSVIPQPLVATTRVMTPGEILLRLKKGVTVPAQGSVVAEVYLDKAGVADAVPAGRYTIPGLNALRQQQVYAKSEASVNFSSSRKVGVLSTEDLEKAKAAMLEVLKTQAQTVVAAPNKDARMLTSVLQYTIDSDKNVGVETDTFTLSGKATVAVLVYDEHSLAEYAGKMLTKQIVDSSEVLENVNSAPTATLENYDPGKGVATLKVVHSGLVNIDPNSRELQKIMFFGKTDNEVRRYLLSLNHVQSVEIKFRPLWNHTVPHVAEHVTIVVKQVK